MKTVFVIGGMSESGKSSLGKYLDSQGVHRLKIVSFLRKVMEQEGAQGDFYEWNERQEKERPLWLKEEFLREFLNYTNEEGIECCCLESLYRPEFGQFLIDHLGAACIVVYVDIPLELRLERQVIRQKLSSLEEAREMLIPRDEQKKEWCVPQIVDIAQEIIDNSGTLEDLEKEGERLIQTYC